MPAVSGPRRLPPELLFALLSAGLLSALQVAGRAGRDSLFLFHFPASDLPTVMMAAALVSIAGAFALSRWLSSTPPALLVPLGFSISAATFVAEWVIVLNAPRVAAVALYLHVTALAPIIVSSFWSVINERFDPYTAKRAIPRMAATGALAGVVGGVGAERVAAWAGLPSVLLGLGALSLLCGLCVAGIGLPKSARVAATREESASGLDLLRRTPLLVQMAAVMLLTEIVGTLVDYAFKVEAAAAYESEALIAFFAAFYTAAGLATFLFQTVAGGRVLQRFGLGGSIALLPLAVALTGLLAAGFGRLWGFVLARAAETVAWNSFFRAGFELLYTPLAPSLKRPTKAWVDVAARSAGALLGSGLLVGLLAVAPDLPSRWVVALAVVGCLVTLFFVRLIHTSYVDQLADSLRSGRVAIGAEQVTDATTAQGVSQSQLGLDRRNLLRQVRAHSERGLRAGQPEPSSAPAPLESVADPAFERVADLCSGDARRIRSALHTRALATDSPGSVRASAIERRLVAHAVALLARPDVTEEVQGFLRRVGTAAAGQLADALLDHGEPLETRVRVARVLGSCGGRRALDGLWLALDDPRFELRVAAGRAAARIATRSPELGPPRDVVLARVGRELRVDDETWTHQGERPSGAGGEVPSVLLDGRALRGVSRSLEHVFTLLSLAHGREQMASALAGLSSGDPSLRGTALEYLDTILPPALRASLFGRLDAEPAAVASQRSSEEMAEELMRTAMAVVIDRTQLRREREDPPEGGEGEGEG